MNEDAKYWVGKALRLALEGLLFGFTPPKEIEDVRSWIFGWVFVAIGVVQIILVLGEWRHQP